MLEYTERDYHGYIIEYATNPASQQGKWMGHFRARRDGADTFASSIANLQDTQTDAQNIAVRFAKEWVDKQPIENGDVGSFETVTSGDFITCEVVVDGAWRPAIIDITALKMLTGTDDRIAGVALARGVIGPMLYEVARRVPPGEEVRLTANDVNPNPVFHRG